MEQKLPAEIPVTDQDGSIGKAKKRGKKGSNASSTPWKRVSQACDRCRSRKDKCDGKKPVCDTCTIRHKICSYTPATKKRGLPEGYVRSMEKLWGLTIREADGIEDTVIGILGGGTEAVDLETLSRVWNDQNAEETLLETWSKSRISGELERLLPLIDSTEEKPVKRKHLESSSSNLDGGVESFNSTPPVARMDRRVYSEIPHRQYNDLPATGSSHDSQRRRIEEPPTPLDDISKVPATLPELPSRAWHLLDVFFSYTHCWLPIVEKHDLLRTSYQYIPKTPKISSLITGCGDHAALWSVLAYADFQHDAITMRDQSMDSQWTGDSIYDHARSLIPTEDGVFELGHVQALSILALLSMGRAQWDRAWLLIGQAVRIAINLGINEGSDEIISQNKVPDKKSRSKHAFLGCFVLDTLIAVRLGRKPQLRREDADRVGLVEEDELDEWNPWMDYLGVRREVPEGPHGPTAVLSTFNQLLHLFKIINSVINDVSTIRQRAETCAELLNELNSWGQVLPALLAPSPTGEPHKPPLLPHRFHLHLAHMSAIAILYSHLSPCSGAMEISDLTVSETFATTARQAMWLFLRQSESFGLLIVPPTYEYFAQIACESAYKVVARIPEGNLTYEEWERNMERSLTSMEKTWPIFAPLRESLTKKMVADTYQNQTPATILNTKFFDVSQQIPSHTKRLSRNSALFNFSAGLGASPTSQRATPSSSHPSFSQPQFNLPANLPGPVSLQTATSPAWPDPNISQSLFIDTPSADQFPMGEGSLSSEIDGDSMFNDFATLDAMEWTNNWDQSLVNLGFTDPDNMNQDFYAFCREPDPLFSNNLVQQLLSNSNADARGGFGESGISFSNPHVEASQILQALSTAQGHALGEGHS